MRLERPILCLVTDRRRLAGGDETFEAARVRLARLARDAVEAAIDLIQVRERDLETAKLVDLVSDMIWFQIDGLAKSRGIEIPDVPVENLLGQSN